MYKKPMTSAFPAAESAQGSGMGNRAIALAIMSGLAGMGAGIQASDPRRPYAGLGAGLTAGAAAPLSFAAGELEKAFKMRDVESALQMDEQTAERRGRVRGIAAGAESRARAEQRRMQEEEEAQADVEGFKVGMGSMTPANQVFLGSIAQGIAQNAAAQRAAQYFPRAGGR